jgi:hypothetical protein
MQACNVIVPVPFLIRKDCKFDLAAGPLRFQCRKQVRPGSRDGVHRHASVFPGDDLAVADADAGAFADCGFGHFRSRGLIGKAYKVRARSRNVEMEMARPKPSHCVFGGESVIRTRDLRIMIPSL